jgi:hypothetical protein
MNRSRKTEIKVALNRGYNRPRTWLLIAALSDEKPQKIPNGIAGGLKTVK